MASGSGSTKTETKIKVFSRVVKLTYLQSQQVRGGGRDLGEIAGEGGGVGKVSTASSNPGHPGFLGIPFLGGSPAKSQSSDSNDTGWTISRTWDETHYDKVRYAIGIRDLGVFSYRFAPVAEIVSKPFRFPKEIQKVQLVVVEQIPAIYPVGPRYITYQVSCDNGQNWYRINPLDHPDLIDEQGLTVPRTLTFNAEVAGEGSNLQKFIETDHPVTELRFRAILLGAENIEQADRYTPVLKRYRLKCYPRGGL